MLAKPSAMGQLGRVLPLLFVAVFLVCCSTRLEAAPMTTVIADDLEYLELQVTWDDLPGTTNPTLVNWFFFMQMQDGPSTGICADGLPAPCWDVLGQLRHTTDPHPELGESGGGDLVQVYVQFSKMGFGRSHPIFVAPHGSEYDVFEAFCDFTNPPPMGSAHIYGYMVPEPATLILLGTGCLCWGWRSGRRRKPSPERDAS